MSRYGRLLRLRHLRVGPTERRLLLDLPLAVAVLLALADVASAEVLVSLPLVVALVVVYHDRVVGPLVTPPGQG